MRPLPFVVLALAASPVLATAARADCQAGVATAMARAEKLPATPGRAALLEQIQRADVAHHEGDEDDCAEQLHQAVVVLDQVDAAKQKRSGG